MARKIKNRLSPPTNQNLKAKAFRSQVTGWRPTNRYCGQREELEASKRVVEAGKGVRVARTVSKREEVVDEPLVRAEVSIERVSINEMIADQDMPAVRYEGETMVVPIFEEVVVTEKCTILKEEVRITRHRRKIRDPQRVVLRTAQVSLEHFDNSAKASDDEASSESESAGNPA